MVVKKFLLVKYTDLSYRAMSLLKYIGMGLHTIETIAGVLGDDTPFFTLSMEEYVDKIRLSEFDPTEYSINVINMESEPEYIKGRFHLEFDVSIFELMTIANSIDRDTGLFKVIDGALQSTYEKLFQPSLAVVSEDNLDFGEEASADSLVPYNSYIKVGRDVVEVRINVCNFNAYDPVSAISKDVIEKILMTPIKHRAFDENEMYDLNRSVYVAHIVYLPETDRKIVSYILRKDVGL